MKYFCIISILDFRLYNMLGVIVNTFTVIVGSIIGLLFKKGEIVRKIKGDSLVEELLEEINKFEK